MQNQSKREITFDTIKNRSERTELLINVRADSYFFESARESGESFSGESCYPSPYKREEG